MYDWYWTEVDFDDYDYEDELFPDEPYFDEYEDFTTGWLEDYI